ncbi:unnamed protein product [Rhodiola kirilowii]
MASGAVLPVSDPAKDDNDKIFRGSAMTKRAAYAAISYMACAVMLVLFNKAALSSYNFPSVNFITLIQVICSCSFLYVLRRKNVISFSEAGQLLDESRLFVSYKTLVQTSPLAVAYLVYLIVTMASIRGVSVPMYTTLRRTTVLFTMVVEYVLTRQTYTRHIIGSVAVIVIGAFIAGARDLSFDAYGYGVVLMANLTTAIYLATIARVGKSCGLNSFGLMWCNGILCGPFLLLWSYVQGDLKAAMSFPDLLSPGFLTVLLLSSMLAFCLNYSVFLNTRLNSALAQTICGNLKDIFTIGFGWILFGGLPFDLLNVMGQGLGFVGSGLYAYYKVIGK